jgi:Arc/MetJ-type ribon-helix-helix transcriptional regulator
MPKTFTSVSLPTHLIDKIKKRIEHTGFTSVSSYVEYVLRTVEAEGKHIDKAFTEEDASRLKKKLKALGYI